MPRSFSTPTEIEVKRRVAALQVRLLPRLDPALASAWNSLQGAQHPFVCAAFIGGLEQHDCLRADLGWRSHHLSLWRDDCLLAAAPCYLKANSHGEFVFDHAWAHAHEHNGLNYYPKLLCGVPYSPIPGPRLLIAANQPESLRGALAAALREHAQAQGLSSVHANFVQARDIDALRADGWLQREDIQFHWRNADYADFDDFLARLTAKRRKEIRRERARVAADGWQFECLHGDQLDPATISRLHALYVGTFADKGNYPALTRGFFAHLASALGRGMVAIVGRRGPQIDAMALFLRGGDTLHGRYWGTSAPTPGLHFETCYYQGINYCIVNGVRSFEPGAQGEHKIARGFLPVRTSSMHWIAHPALRAAIARSLQQECTWIAGYERAAAAHSPFAQRD